MANKNAAAGWYPDQDPRFLRWWDGTRWTGHTRPNESVLPPPPAQASTIQPQQPQTPTRDPVQSSQTSAPTPTRHRIFGGKKDLETEVERLTLIVDQLGVTERDALVDELTRLRSEVPALRSEHASLLAQVEPLRTEVADLVALRTQAGALQAEVTQLTAQRDVLNAETAELQNLLTQLPAVRAEYDQLRAQIVETRETSILQEVGVYEYQHPLDNAPAYKAKLTGISAQIKDMVKAGTAVQGSTTWTVNGSVSEGKKMVREFSKLMLRAYNNEADNAVRSMKPYALDSSVARLAKARDTISKLGGTMNIRVTDRYHSLRLEELQLTADYLAKVAEEKEREREERARLREEEIARREFEREQERLRKEQSHYQATVEALRQQGDAAGADQAQAKLAEISDALDGITRRAANIRAGHVYVISNIGAFGPDMVKIGMTRRLDPMDRVRELGDASVPFHYDVHAMVFSDDAVGLETSLHHELEDCRVNLVNMRREFFRTAPPRVRDILLRHDASIVHWIEEPEAIEWRQSETTRRQQQEVGVGS